MLTPLIVVALALTVGAALVTPASAATRATLRLSPATAMPMETVTVAGSLPGASRRAVALSHQIGRRWVVLRRGRTNARGSFVLSFPAPRVPATWRLRVVAPAAGRAAAVLSPVRTLTVVRQSATLSLPVSAGLGAHLRANLLVRPVRAGRYVEFQELESGSWVRVGRARLSRRGRASLSLPGSTTTGTLRYRALVLPFHRSARLLTAARSVAVSAEVAGSGATPAPTAPPTPGSSTSPTPGSSASPTPSSNPGPVTAPASRPTATDPAALATPVSTPPTTAGGNQSGTLQVNGPAQGVDVDAAGGVSTWTFTLSTPTRVVLTSTRGTWATSEGVFRLRSSKGAVLETARLTALARLIKEWLPAGTYTVQVDPSGDQTGTSTISLTSPADVSGSVGVDAGTVPVSIGEPAQQARYTFTTTTPGRVVVTTTGASFWTEQGALRLLDASGAVRDSTQLTRTATLAEDNLPAGTWTVLVDPYFDETGQVALSVSE